jgi:hypothetical protein
MEPKAPLPKLGPINHCPWNLSCVLLRITNDDQLLLLFFHDFNNSSLLMSTFKFNLN